MLRKTRKEQGIGTLHCSQHQNSRGRKDDKKYRKFFLKCHKVREDLYWPCKLQVNLSLILPISKSIKILKKRFLPEK